MLCTVRAGIVFVPIIYKRGEITTKYPLKADSYSLFVFSPIFGANKHRIKTFIERAAGTGRYGENVFGSLGH